jgi:hypothetical protein
VRRPARAAEERDELGLAQLGVVERLAWAVALKPLSADIHLSVIANSYDRMYI